MAVTFGILLRERGNEDNWLDIGPFCTSWRFQLLRRNGCGPASFTAVMTDAEWAALEAGGLMTTDAVVHIYLKMNEDVTHRVWSGTLKTYPLAKNTPPDRRRRKFTCAPVWSQLKKPGCLLLRAFDDDETVRAIIWELVNATDPDHTCMSDSTDVSANAIDCMAGYNFSPGRTLFIDQDAESCVKKCAEVYGDVVYGVAGGDDHLYFEDETNSTAAPVATFRMGTHADGVTKFSRQKHVQRRQYNHVIVEGREAKAGNPMSVEYEDPALATDASLIRRTNTVKAPENVKGATLLRWAEFLVAQNKDPKETALLSVAGIDTKFTEDGHILRTWQQINGNIAVEDEEGVSLGQWPIQGITYSMTGTGAFGAKFELGDALQQDLVDAFGFRETLRELAVYDIKEFSNQIELQAMNDNWLEDAYVFFVLNHGMRNSVRVSLQSLRHIDFDHAGTHSLILDATDDGITGMISTTDAALVGQFVTQQIPVGTHFDNWALLRRNTYPELIGGHGGAGVEDFVRVKISGNSITWTAEEMFVPATVPLTAEGATEPTLCSDGLAPDDGGEMYYSFHGVMKHVNWVHPSATITWHCTPGPYGLYADGRQFLVFGYIDKSNYHFIEFWGESPYYLAWKAGKYVDGEKTYDDVVAGNGYWLPATAPEGRFHARIIPDIANGSYTFMVRIWGNPPTNGWFAWRTYVGTPGFFAPTLAAYRVGVGQQWTDVPNSNWAPLLQPMGAHWTGLSFMSCTVANEWYISRDGGASWEGPLDPDTGAMVNLGAYTGGGTEQDYVLIKGFVAYPQLLTSYGVGWK